MKKSDLSILTARFHWRGMSFFLRWLRRSAESGQWTPRRKLMIGGGGFLSLISVLSFHNPLPYFQAHVAQPLLAEFRAPPGGQMAMTFCAALGDRQPVALTDGTRVELDSGACISVEFAAKQRTVRLESGEALFQVARDPRRPFVVETGPISIQDVGTEFDVFRRKFDTRVAVIEGAVQIPSWGTNPQPLTALQQIDVPDDAAQARVRKSITRSDFDRMTAWVHGDIVLEKQTLQEAIDEFARYQPIQAEFRDPRIAEQRYTGTFHTTNVNAFLAYLKGKCIYSDHKNATQITFTRETDKRSGTACQ